MERYRHGDNRILTDLKISGFIDSSKFLITVEPLDQIFNKLQQTHQLYLQDSSFRKSHLLKRLNQVLKRDKTFN